MVILGVVARFVRRNHICWSQYIVTGWFFGGIEIEWWGRKWLVMSVWVKGWVVIRRFSWSIEMCIWVIHLMLSGDRDEQQQKTAECVFWTVITSNASVYSVPIGDSTGLVMILSFMVMEVEGSSSLMVIKTLRYFTRRFTVFYNLELPNSTMIGHVR